MREQNPWFIILSWARLIYSQLPRWCAFCIQEDDKDHEPPWCCTWVAGRSLFCPVWVPGRKLWVGREQSRPPSGLEVEASYFDRVLPEVKLVFCFFSAPLFFNRFSQWEERGIWLMTHYKAQQVRFLPSRSWEPYRTLTSACCLNLIYSIIKPWIKYKAWPTSLRNIVNSIQPFKGTTNLYLKTSKNMVSK